MIKSILIYGNSPSSWLSAAILRQMLGINVTLLLPRESQQDGKSEWLATPYVETLSPRALVKLNHLGLQQSQWIKSCIVAPHLGSRLINVQNKKPQQDVILPHSLIAPDIGGVGFQHYLNSSEKQNYEAYSLACELIRNRKFVQPVAYPNSIFSSYDIGLSVELCSFTKPILGFAQQLGVKVIPATSVKVIASEENIVHIETASARLNADLYIDMSQQQTLMSDRAPNNDPAMDLPCSSKSTLYNASLVFEAQVKATNLPNCDELSMLSNGLLLSHCIGQKSYCQYFYNASIQSAEQAFTDIKKEKALIVREHYKQVSFAQTVTKQAWQGNVIAMAEARVPPCLIGRNILNNTIESLSHLVDLMPVDSDFSLNRREFNRLSMAGEQQNFDFQQTYYMLNTIPKSGFYVALSTKYDNNFKHRHSLFEQTGYDAHFEDDPFEVHEWRNLMLALGVRVENNHPLLNVNNKQKLEQIAKRVKNAVEST